MKFSVLLAGIIILCILLSGCIGIKQKAPATPTPTNTFVPFSPVSETETPTVTATPSPTTNSTNTTPKLKGLVRIAIGGWPGEATVSVDDTRIGVVKTRTPVTQMLDEGNHTVAVCCGSLCEYENITISFGKQVNLDFSERLQRDCEFLEPTARVLSYYMSGESITVNIEFINPTEKTLEMTAEVNCGYSYIDSRSNDRVSNVAQGQVFATVEPGRRVTNSLWLSLASGSSYRYGIPTIVSQSAR